MAELADARGLNPRAAQAACGFKPHSGHQVAAWMVFVAPSASPGFRDGDAGLLGVESRGCCSWGRSAAAWWMILVSPSA